MRTGTQQSSAGERRSHASTDVYVCPPSLNIKRAMRPIPPSRKPPYNRGNVDGAQSRKFVRGRRELRIAKEGEINTSNKGAAGRASEDRARDPAQGAIHLEMKRATSQSYLWKVKIVHPVIRRWRVATAEQDGRPFSASSSCPELHHCADRGVLKCTFDKEVEARSAAHTTLRRPGTTSRRVRGLKSSHGRRREPSQPPRGTKATHARSTKRETKGKCHGAEAGQRRRKWEKARVEESHAIRRPGAGEATLRQRDEDGGVQPRVDCGVGAKAEDASIVFG
ncbi:hypothetical protein K438DRAFT_1750417 [Mycena galopus ATCC 62051]|nr:hypothetical protein K438DRAFT_1750417 [Mycena galopus ATCC 62051]